MGFADKLKARAEETGKKTVIAEKPEHTKAETKSAFASALKTRKQEVTKQQDPSTIETEFKAGLIAHWSYTALTKFEKCPYELQLSKVDKIPQEQGEGAERGSAIHDHCEAYVRGQVEALNPNLKGKRSKIDMFHQRFDNLKADFNDGKVMLEEEWGIRKDWSPCTWQDAELWGRAKLDVFVRESETSCRIIDHKTGRFFGNEVKHADQGMSYALVCYHRFPEIESFTVEFWYLDHNHTTSRTYTRRQLGLFLKKYHERAMALTTATVLHAKPSRFNCMWCPYGDSKYGNGHCKFYVEG